MPLIFAVMLKICFAQDFVELYKEYLPGNLTRNVTFTNQVNDLLTSYGTLDPSLIYYYIRHLDLKLNYGIFDADSNYSNHLKYLANTVRFKKSEWAQAQIDRIRKTAMPQSQVENLTNALSQYLIEKPAEMKPPEELKIDRNLRNYFIYLYLSRKKDAHYDPTIKYSEWIKIEAGKIIEEFNTAYKQAEELSQSQKEQLAQKAFAFTFLFKDSYLNIFPETIDFYFYEFLGMMLKDTYFKQHAFSIGLYNEFIPTTFDATYTYTDFLGNDYSYNFDVTFQNTTFIHLGYQYTFRDKLAAFKFINLNIGYSIINIKTLKDEPDVISWGLDYETAVYYYRWHYAFKNVRDLSTYAVSAQIMTPVYYLNKSFSLELGVNYTLRHYQYLFDLIEIYEYRKYAENIDTKVNNEKSVQVDKTEHTIYPVLAINYSIPNFINLRVEYLIPTVARIGLTAYIKF